MVTILTGREQLHPWGLCRSPPGPSPPSPTWTRSPSTRSWALSSTFSNNWKSGKTGQIWDCSAVLLLEQNVFLKMKYGGGGGGFTSSIQSMHSLARSGLNLACDWKQLELIEEDLRLFSGFFVVCSGEAFALKHKLRNATRLVWKEIGPTWHGH